MKRLLLSLLICTAYPAFGLPSIKSFFKSGPEMTQEDQIKEAIATSDVYTVIKMVDNKVSQDDLNYYIKLAANNFGKVPTSSVKEKAIGISKLILGMALFYKTVDYFQSELKNVKFNFKTRYDSAHAVLMDIAGLSGFLSSYGYLNSAIKDISPHSNYKSQLLIDLYLKSLLKN